MISQEKDAVSAAERTIYIVEKHLAVADSMRALLESAGLCVEVYDSGAEFADAFDSLSLEGGPKS